MGSTYTPRAAVDLVKNFVHGIPLAATQANVCDMVNSIMWTFYPWGWSIKSLTAITCTDGTQDYTPTDTDILRPLKMRLVRTDLSPAEYRELGFLANLSPELSRKGGLDSIRAVGWFASQNFFRLDLAASVQSPTVLQIQGEYQKVPTRITDATMDTVFTFPDHYYPVFIEGLKWKMYQLSDDPRAGGVQMSKNGNMQRVYTGQLGLFWDELLMMARTEDLGNGDEFQYPESSMGAGHSYFPGLFGI